MSESVYKVIELIGTSAESWEQAAKLAMMTAAKNLRDIRVAEVVAMDIHVEDEQIVFRTKMKISFKYHDDA